MVAHDLLRPRLRRLAAVGTVFGMALAIAACGAGGPTRPSDPRELVIQAATATASLSSARLHLEGRATNSDPNGPQGSVTVTIDGDVLLATRELAARATVVSGAAQPAQVSDMIATGGFGYYRQGGAGSWYRTTLSLDSGPTNAAIVDALLDLLRDPAVTYERRDAAECTLGTCDVVVVHVPGRALASRLAALLGMPLDERTASQVPTVDVEVRIAQSNLYVSELRTTIASGPVSVDVLAAVSDPGADLVIAPPPPAQIEGFGQDFGGGGQATPAPAAQP
jgi:hypothetical protein